MPAPYTVFATPQMICCFATAKLSSVFLLLLCPFRVTRISTWFQSRALLFKLETSQKKANELKSEKKITGNCFSKKYLVNAQKLEIFSDLKLPKRFQWYLHWIFFIGLGPVVHKETLHKIRGLHSTEVAYLLLTQQPWFDSQRYPK